MVVAYIDGLSEPRNPGTGTYGFVIYDGKKRISFGEGLAGRGVTNNYAEYAGLVMALTKLRQLGIIRNVRIKSDSQLLVGQMRGEMRVKGGGYIKKYQEAVELAHEFDGLEFEWVPREHNQEADMLSRVAYERHRER